MMMIFRKVDMTIHFDEKGKFFTEIVTKKPVPVNIQTLTHRIHGYIYVSPGERIKDALDQSTQFVAVTDARVMGASGEEIDHAEFMIINVDQIVWLIPDQGFDQSREQEGANT
jgi:hypothetical protein